MLQNSLERGPLRECHKEGTLLVLGRNPAPTKTNKPGVISSDKSYSSDSEEEKSDREGQDSPVPEQDIYSPKERVHRGKTDPRPVNPQYLYKTSSIQNADIKRDQAVVTKGILDNLIGRQGRLLAYHGQSSKESLPKLPLEKPGLAVQSNAIWPERRTPAYLPR